MHKIEKSRMFSINSLFTEYFFLFYFILHFFMFFFIISFWWDVVAFPNCCFVIYAIAMWNKFRKYGLFYGWFSIFICLMIFNDVDNFLFNFQVCWILFYFVIWFFSFFFWWNIVPCYLCILFFVKHHIKTCKMLLSNSTLIFAAFDEINILFLSCILNR